MASFLGEIKRRKVFQVAAAYAVVAWLLVQVSIAVEAPLSLPEWADTLVITLVVLGFPLALILSWAYDATPHGIVRERKFKTTEDVFSAAGVQQLEVAGANNSVIVLPFENLSPDPANAYFADGLTEELIADLTKIESLRVISRTSAMSLKGMQKDVGTIARELGVRYALEGSVRRAGNALRVTAQLIDAHADSHLWAEKYSGTVDDIFEVQEELSRQIVDALKVKLTPEEEKQLFTRQISDVRAYEYYLRARGNIYSFDGPLVERAIRDLNSALEILGDNVLLLRALGMAYWQSRNVGISDENALEKVEDCARRIGKLDPDDPGRYLLRGAALWLRGDCRAAVIELRHAYRKDHADSDTLLLLGVASLSTGQMDLAGYVLHEAYRIDPLSALSVLLVGYHHFFSGRFDEAADFQERSLQLDPEVMMAAWTAVRTFVAAGKHSRARECADYLRTRYPDSPYSESADLFLKGLNGQMKDMPATSPSLRMLASRDSEVSQCISDGYAFGGDDKKALEWLKISLNAGFMNYSYLSMQDPFIADFRDLAEWKEVLEQVQKQLNEFQSDLTPLSLTTRGFREAGDRDSSSRIP